VGSDRRWQAQTSPRLGQAAEPPRKFRKTNGNKLFGELAELLGALGELEAMSAVKDLVSLLVLYEFGGYYLDTTTSIVGRLCAGGEPARRADDHRLREPREPARAQLVEAADQLR